MLLTVEKCQEDTLSIRGFTLSCDHPFCGHLGIHAVFPLRNTAIFKDLAIPRVHID